MIDRKILGLGALLLLSPASLPAQEGGVGGDIIFKADKSTIFEENYNITLEGNVHLDNGEMELKADKVVANFVEPDTEGGETRLSDATAEGNVWARSDDIQVTSNRAKYVEAQQYMVFYGNVDVHQGESHVASEEVRLHLDTGIYELVGGVKGRIRGSF